MMRRAGFGCCQLAQRAQQAGHGVPGRDEWWYKAEYNRRLMQTVDVLGDHRPQLGLLFQLCQPQMGGIGLCALYDQLIAVKTVELLRVFLPEGMAEDGFGRVVVFLVVQPVHAAEIRDAAFRRNARAAEKDDAAAFCNDVFQCLDHS